MPTSLGVPQTIATGRKNMLASLRYYMNANLPKTLPGSVTYMVKWEQYLEAQDFPSISFQDFGIPNFGGQWMDDLIGTDTSGNKVHGKQCQTMIELNCMTNVTDQDAAVLQLYQMADQLEYMFYYSSMGQVDENQVRILPRIALLDFDNGSVDTGATVWAPMEKDAIWIPNYMGMEQNMPQIRRLSIKCRIFWHYLRPLVTSS